MQWIGGASILVGLVLMRLGSGSKRAVIVDESPAGGYFDVRERS